MFSRLLVEPLHGKMMVFRLAQDMTWNARIECLTLMETMIVIPEGFITDFASVPRVFWLLIPPMGKYNKCAVLHDYLCVRAYTTRSYANKVFLQAMVQEDVPKWKRKVIYWAVERYRVFKGLE